MRISDWSSDVCSSDLREMRALGSLVMREADATKLPAGSALAVDRDLFAQRVTRALADHPNVALVRDRIDTQPGEGSTIVATGPLPDAALAQTIGAPTCTDPPAFSDPTHPYAQHHPTYMQ